MRYGILLLGIVLMTGVAIPDGQPPKAVLWWDGTANLERIRSRESIASVLDKCVAAGIDAVVFDVKPIIGDVLYASAIADRLTEWKGVDAPRDFDPLAVVIEEARARKIRIYASVNVFSEGHKYFRRGIAYRKPELQCVAYDVRRWLVFPDGEIPINGDNRKPTEGEITITSSSQRQTMAVDPDTLLIVADGGGRVTAVVDGVSATEDVAIPSGGFVLAVGASSRERILRQVEIGSVLGLRGEPDLKPIAESTSEAAACFVNPILPEVRTRELSIIRELASTYDIDGIILDRMRYSGYTTDFSDASRRAFEADQGRTVERFPEDILEFSSIPGMMIRGPLYGQWALWRARNMKDFLSEARKVVNTARLGASVGVYVGAWYDEYDAVGVNWAREGLAPTPAWLPKEYAETGYADLCDLLFAGCYYRCVAPEDDPAGRFNALHTVGGAARRAVEVVGGASRVIGSVYLDLYEGDNEQMKRAVRECINVTGGVMLFDLVHVETQEWWDDVRSALTPAE